jgi:hypothetical protein
MLAITPAWADSSVATPSAESLPLFEYSLADDEKLHPDADYRFTEWKPGTRLFTAGGASVTVEEVGERARVGARVNRWYTVRIAGDRKRMFGGELTPFAFTTDLDGDGKPEVVAVTFTDDFQIAVQIGASTVKLRAAGGAFLSQKGGNASASVVDASVAGLPLLRVDSRPEACADYSETYVSFAGGQAKIALALSGLADPPVHSTPSVKFNPKTRTAVVTQTNSQEDDNGRTHTKKIVTRYRLAGGVFVEGR